MAAGAQRLLLLACSERKRPDLDLLPAIERYDGPAFRVLRRYLRGNPTDPPAVCILSADLGLIRADHPIPDYDRPMTLTRARELAPLIRDLIAAMLDADCYQSLLIYAGKIYLTALDQALDVVRARLPVMVAEGPRGKKLSALRDWLHGAPQDASRVTARRSAMVRVRGIMVNLTPEQALQEARRALAAGATGTGRYQSWYVPVGGRRVAPKWLVSQLTGLRPGQFGTGEALRVLLQLGLPVRRA